MLERWTGIGRRGPKWRPRTILLLWEVSLTAGSIVDDDPIEVLLLMLYKSFFKRWIWWMNPQASMTGRPMRMQLNWLELHIICGRPTINVMYRSISRSGSSLHEPQSQKISNKRRSSYNNTTNHTSHLPTKRLQLTHNLIGKQSDLNLTQFTKRS
jgi:hypothetical protein